jgi:hypothetical protein
MKLLTLLLLVAVAGATPIWFGVSGDNHITAYPANANHRYVLAQAYKQLPADGSGTWLYLGDNTTTGKALQCGYFVRAESTLWAKTANHYFTMGNHDAYDTVAYKTYFTPDRYYSVRRGDTFALHVLDHTLPHGESTPQWLWLVAELKRDSAERVRWIAVAGHYPHYQDTVDLLPLYEQYGVTFVFQGHEHLYQHDAIVTKSGRSIHCFTVGTGGVGLANSPGNEWMSTTLSRVYKYGFGVLELTDAQATWKFVDIYGTVYDRLTLQRALVETRTGTTGRDGGKVTW